MKLLTKRTDYAVRALLVLAGEKEGFVSVKEISEREKIPYSFMRQILLHLQRVGYVESKEGGKGGFRLKVPPREISVHDLIRTFQGKVSISECMFRKKICQNRQSCVLRKNILRIEELLVSEFHGITIESLIKDLEEGR